MSEADFCGMDAGEYYATKGFLDRERFYRKQEMEEQMKNRVTVRHGMLSDLKTYLKQSGWKLEETVGAYEVLRARNPNYPRPLLVHDRAERGVGYSRGVPAWLFPATKGTATPKPCRWPIARRNRKVTCRPTLRS